MIEYSSDVCLSDYVKAIDIKRYLKIRGWQEVPLEHRNFSKFKSPSPISDDHTYLELLVPLNESYRDYSHVINSIIDNISIFEDRSFEDVLSQILILADCLKTKIIEARKGMIPLNQGVSLYQGLLDLIIYSAGAEFEPPAKKRHPRKSGNAIKYAESSLMGQSELGSYVANIFIPLPRPNTEFSWTITEPFPRKVVLRILRGLEDLTDSILENSPDPIIDNYSRGLNAGMCEALLNIIDAGIGNRVLLDAALEPLYLPPEDISTEFTLSYSDKRFLAEAMDALIKEDPIVEERAFFGYPEILASPQEVEKGTIKLKSFDIERNKTITIKIELNKPDYQKAYDAHGGKKFIRIKGILLNIRGRWHLEDPQELEVLEAESELPWKALDKFSSERS